MINIHITDKGVESHIENTNAIDVLETVANAIIAVLPACHIPLDMFAGVLLDYDRHIKNENEED